MSDERTDFERRIARTLDEGVERLDGATRSRLRQARARALDSLADRPARRRQRLAAGLALAALLLALLWWPGDRDEGRLVPPLAPLDFELLTSNEPIEIYQELDFYQWLEQERDDAG